MRRLINRGCCGLCRIECFSVALRSFLRRGCGFFDSRHRGLGCSYGRELSYVLSGLLRGRSGVILADSVVLATASLMPSAA